MKIIALIALILIMVVIAGYVWEIDEMPIKLAVIFLAMFDIFLVLALLQVLFF